MTDEKKCKCDDDDKKEETFHFQLDENNEYEMTIEDACAMHQAMSKGADKLLAQISVHSYMMSMKEDIENYKCEETLQ